MQIQVFSVSMDGDDDSTLQLNRFLRTNKVLCVEKFAVVAQGRQYWSFCVEYLERVAAARESARGAANANNNKPRTEYRERLTDAQFELYLQDDRQARLLGSDGSTTRAPSDSEPLSAQARLLAELANFVE